MTTETVSISTITLDILLLSITQTERQMEITELMEKPTEGNDMGSSGCFLLMLVFGVDDHKRKSLLWAKKRGFQSFRTSGFIMFCFNFFWFKHHLSSYSFLVNIHQIANHTLAHGLIGCVLNHQRNSRELQRNQDRGESWGTRNRTK